MRTLWILLAAVLVVGVGTVLGLTVFSGGGGDSPEEPETPLATPLGKADTTTMSVARASFCDRVPETEVSEALGSAPEKSASHENGERAELDEGLTDVSGEYGCSWSTADGATAAAWVFAPPVTQDRAKELAGEVPKGCERLGDAPAFGEPTRAQWCDQDGPQVTYAGLFGDAWLTCELSPAERMPRKELVELSGRWCLAVARAAEPAA